MKLGNVLRFAAAMSALMIAFAASPILADEEAAPAETAETTETTETGDETPPADQDDADADE